MSRTTSTNILRPASRCLRSILAAGTGLTLVGLAACSGGGGDGGPVTLTYAIWDEVQQPAMEEIVTAFEAEHENITVEIAVTPWEQYWTSLETATTGGSAADVFWMTYNYFPMYVDGGMLAPLDDMVEEGTVNADDYIPVTVEAYTWDGSLYGVPKDIDTIGLWYNRSHFDDAGLDYPDETWTWEDVHEAAAALTTDEHFGIGASISDQQSYYTTIPQAGGYVINADRTESGLADPEAIAGIQYWVDFIEEGSSPTLQQMTDTEALQMFNSGRVSMLYDGSWTTAEFASNPESLANVDVAPLPAGPANNYSVVNTLANVMYANTEHPEEAAEFLAFLGSEQAATIQAEDGIVIPAYQGTADIWAQSVPEFNLSAFTSQLETGVLMPASLNSAEWRGYQEEQMTSAWTGEEPVAVVAQRMADQMNEVLAAEQDG